MTPGPAISARRRFWRRRHEHPMPPVPVPVSDTTMALGQIAIVVTLVSWAIFVATTIARASSAPATIRMTLLSAALQEYPGLKIVLLIDDPPNPQYAAPHALVEAARSIPGEIERLLAD